MRQHTAQPGAEIDEAETLAGGEKVFQRAPYLVAGKVQRHLGAEGAPINRQQSEECGEKEAGRDVECQHQHQRGNEQELDGQPPARQPHEIAQGGRENAAQQRKGERGWLQAGCANGENGQRKCGGLQQQRDNGGRQPLKQRAQISVPTRPQLPDVWLCRTAVPPATAQNPSPCRGRAR